MGSEALNLLPQILAHAERRPGAAALVMGGAGVVSYGELARRSSLWARAWANAGIGDGDVVLVARGVSPGLYTALLAAFRLGAVVMFPEPAAGLPGLAQAVEAARPRAVAAGGLFRWLRPALAPLARLPMLPEPAAGPALPGQGFVDVDADHAALITFTSGSTGRPKGVVRSAGFLALQHSLLEGIRGTTPEHVDLISLPVFVLSNLVAGGTSVIPAGNLRRPASLNGRRIIAQMRATGVNRIVAPPAVCARIAEAAQAGAGPLELEAMFTGGGPVFPNLLHALHAAAPGARIHAVYGSTEAEPIAHVRYDDVGAADWTAMARGAGLLAGAPVPQAAVEIVDDEIQVSGPHVNRGYLDPAQDATTKVTRDGRLWHRTGDAARFDERGRLWLLGRREAAGGGLFPFAVETAALSWRGVRQAALVAREGRRPTLCLAGEGLDEAALRLRASTLGELEVRLMRRIPMDARHNSKVDYAALRRRLGRAA